MVFFGVGYDNFLSKLNLNDKISAYISNKLKNKTKERNLEYQTAEACRGIL